MSKISLPVANLGEIPGKIAMRFLPLWICFLARILARFALGFWPDFSRQDYCFPARIMVRFAAGLCQDFGRWDFCFSARILASFAAGSRRDFGHREFREEKSRRPKSCRDPGGIPTKIAAGSRQDPGPYFTRVHGEFERFCGFCVDRYTYSNSHCKTTRKYMSLSKVSQASKS